MSLQEELDILSRALFNDEFLMKDQNEALLPRMETESFDGDAEESQLNKRKSGEPEKSDNNKKSRQATSIYNRRNIRRLFTKQKLQGETILAMQAETDRLRRLEQINESHLQTNSNSFDSLIDNNSSQFNNTLNDDMHNHGADEAFDSYTDSRVLTSVLNNDLGNNQYVLAHNEDSHDSDVQVIDPETQVENENIIKKLRSLHMDDRVNVPDKNGNVLINVNHPIEDCDLYIPKHLCQVIKPHQIGGIRFMYDNIVESFDRFRTTNGLGCILAHSMGCGKTLQIITFIDVLFRFLTTKTVLVVVPINTIQNWKNEFDRWCPENNCDIGYARPYQLYVLNDTVKKFEQRMEIIEKWSQLGGTLVIGYEMFRLIVTRKTSQTRTRTKINRTVSTSNVMLSSTNEANDEMSSNESMENARNSLINTDIVICDEGHRIKNPQAAIAVALKSIRTQRRVVLTGYPLQNNLFEYWCMVDFIRPNYLGCKKEFSNLFERPISNGQCNDSTPKDQQLMRERAHVLHNLLEGFVQRREHNVLQNELPSKTEFVILLKLSPVQRELYLKFLEATKNSPSFRDKSRNPLQIFQICCKMWNHPDVLWKAAKEGQDYADFDIDIDIDQSNNPTTRSLTTKSKSSVNLNFPNPLSPQASAFSMERKDFDYSIFDSIFDSYTYDQIANGVKFQVALSIIDLAMQCNDKVLLFSQSLLTLTKFEEFLAKVPIPNTQQTWKKNVNYYRLDGNTNALDREKLINNFNASDSNIKLFLLSTKAGCLGINLIAANRVIVMDVSWNPCLDVQSICRVYRYGQMKHCYIYRLIADFTMEKHIYDKQLAKQGMSYRVIDELQPQNQSTKIEIEKLIHFALEGEQISQNLTGIFGEAIDDPILRCICQYYSQSITKNPFTHESLLLDRKECQLTSADKRRAKKEYQNQKQRSAYLYQSRQSSSTSKNTNYGNISNQNVNELFLSRNQSCSPQINNSPVTTDMRLQRLKEKGVEIKACLLKNQLEVKIVGSIRQAIPAGTKIYVIKTPRHSYIRTPEGKFFLIRQSEPLSSLSPINEMTFQSVNTPSSLSDTFNSPFVDTLAVSDFNQRTEYLLQSLNSNAPSTALNLDDCANFDGFMNQNDSYTVLYDNDNLHNNYSFNFNQFY